MEMESCKKGISWTQFFARALGRNAASNDNETQIQIHDFLTQTST